LAEGCVGGLSWMAEGRHLGDGRRWQKKLVSWNPSRLNKTHMRRRKILNAMISVVFWSFSSLTTVFILSFIGLLPLLLGSFI
jgi:hypothetical protein